MKIRKSKKKIGQTARLLKQKLKLRPVRNYIGFSSLSPGISPYIINKLR